MSVLTMEEAAEKTRRARQNGQTTVTTNGCFDLLHVGHVRYLRHARSLGDLLIVGVNSDESVRRLKGSPRPFLPAEERAELIAALKPVTSAVVFEEDAPIAMIEALRPDIHVKGGDYSIDQIIEREAVERGGGRVVLAPHIETRSTTEIAAAIRSPRQAKK
ncbi:MAG: D-glycero-beta-D-manno-heptose 1-phosphate adenylyltransferase [Candidatus Poribacteria bacterium]|nr:D-glycero-beta-D-manno-heptose 1-phosphate adenylyltransferase [Candidatus Poribacteria bacterium]